MTCALAVLVPVLIGAGAPGLVSPAALTMADGARATAPTSAERSAPDEQSADPPRASVPSATGRAPTSDPMPESTPGPASDSMLDPAPDSMPDSMPDPAPDPMLDTVELADGSTVQGRLIRVAEGAYVTMAVGDATQSLPWTEIRRVRIERPGEAALELELTTPRFAPRLEPTRDTPYVEILTRDGRPVSLLRLRTTTERPRQRYSTGYDEVCRAPCARPVEAGSRHFFVDRNPWTASKVFELPEADYVQLRVRPGRVRMRKTGIGMMIGGGVAMVAGITMLALPTESRAWNDIGVAITSIAGFSVPVGALLFGISRAKVKAEIMATPPRASQTGSPRPAVSAEAAPDR